MQDKLITKKKSLNFKGKLEDINAPLIMGILNLTPDSFYDGGKNDSVETNLINVKKMIEDGADIIDFGAYSSRPGAKHISEQEEMDRLLPTLHAVHKMFPEIKISVDTFRAKVAKQAIFNGANMVNDISGGSIEPEIWNVSAIYKAPYIAMHMQGNPQTMQDAPHYEKVVEEIIYDFSQKVSEMKKAGLVDIIIDPGFGFGKTLTHNYEILQNLEAFQMLGLPILVGFSRKSMIYKYLNSQPEEALNGTTILNTIALQKGADILRVHDVKQAKETLQLLQKVANPNL